jgi:formamidopyrimidine-DNA glycosylase
LLWDQTALAGIGNAYSDENLHTAKLSPKQAASALTRPQINDLFHSNSDTLSATVTTAIGQDELRKLKDTKRSRFRVQARAGAHCNACDHKILSVAAGDYSYEYCPGAQTGGKPLTDLRTSRFLK